MGTGMHSDTNTSAAWSLVGVPSSAGYDSLTRLCRCVQCGNRQTEMAGDISDGHAA